MNRQQTLQSAIAKHQSGQLDEAEALYRQYLAGAKYDIGALNNLAILLRARGEVAEPIALLERALKLAPSLPAVYNNLGNALLDAGKLQDAIQHFRTAIRLEPNYAEAHSNLGNALHAQNQIVEAIGAYERAIVLNPHDARSLSNLAGALSSTGQIDQAIDALNRARALDPSNPTVHMHLGNVLGDAARLDEALACYRKAIELDPTFTQAHSNLVYAIHFHPATNRETIQREHAAWAAGHAAKFAASQVAHANDRSPSRRLRIGYISPDFHLHPVSVFIEPVLANHDHDQFEVFCYSNVLHDDAVTERCKSHADHWRSIVGRADDDAAEIIRADGIDILIDLAQHMHRNRILIFARKPAPVQVAYLGYNSTTGLAAIDWRISDPYMETDDRPLGPERVMRLPGCYWCYAPPSVAPPDIGELPALRNGFVTFASMNNLVKVNDAVIDVWAKLLHAVPTSRLLIATNGGRSSRAHLGEAFQRVGIAPGRIELLDRVRYELYFEIYNRIDVALDTFPYNGGTTTLDALWMGVPVVTLAGDMPLGRAGVTILTNLGLPKLIAADTDEYVQTGARLASDPTSLANLRSTLRQRMSVSPVMDCLSFTRGLEALFREMWTTWIAEGGI